MGVAGDGSACVVVLAASVQGQLDVVAVVVLLTASGLALGETGFGISCWDGAGKDRGEEEGGGEERGEVEGDHFDGLDELSEVQEGRWLG